MHSPSEAVHNWLCNSHGAEMPGYVKAAAKQIQRYEDAEAQKMVDWSYEDLSIFAEMIDQQRLEFSEEDSHANSRLAVARFLDTVVRPAGGADDLGVSKLAQRLRDARQTGTIMYNKESGKFITMWDSKAGLPLLCPDDAREEAMRVQRRIVPAILSQLRTPGVRAYYGVLTMPNAAPGKLRAAMRSINKRLAALMKKAKRDMAKGDNTLPFIGAYAVLESPLGWRRDWHPHLNVIFVTKGWFDFAKLREHWFHNLHLERLSGDLNSIEAALRELIKYSVRTVPEKSCAKLNSRVDVPSNQHCDRGSLESSSSSMMASSAAPPWDPSKPTHLSSAATEHKAPALTEWTAGEFTEWWAAHKGFRRSRGYGCLYNVEKPERESIDGFVSVGTVKRDGARIVRRFSLLEFIPGDKSSTVSLKDRLREHLQRLFGDPERHRQALQLMERARAAWQTMQKTTH